MAGYESAPDLYEDKLIDLLAIRGVVGSGYSHTDGTVRWYWSPDFEPPNDRGANLWLTVGETIHLLASQGLPHQTLRMNYQEHALIACLDGPAVVGAICRHDQLKASLKRIRKTLGVQL